jgi:dihydroxyacetone kinase-like predicted kinase
VRQGQFLAVIEGNVVAIRDEPVAALHVVATRCEAASAEVVTLVAGADVGDDELEAAAAMLGEGPEVDVIDGGQRPVRYYLGVE